MQLSIACGIKTVKDINQHFTDERIERVRQMAEEKMGRKPIGSELVHVLLLSTQMKEDESSTLLTQFAEVLNTLDTSKIVIGSKKSRA